MEPFSLRSELLSAFSGTNVSFETMVMTPADYDPACGWAVHYVIHGFGSSALETGVGYTGDILARHAKGKAPPLVRVFLDANHALGHHVFADSANMGPWGTALVHELLPAIEARYGAIADPAARFVSGHSSGGWSSLWLQVEHAEIFGGVWSLAPDPVDFRDFVNVDVYRFENMYRDPDGQPIPVERDGTNVVATVEEFVRRELHEEPVGRQIYYSFDAVFSPRGSDGQPRFLFDRETGRIDREVAEAWRHYDISARLRREWPRLAPLLRGKLHVIVGLRDTYYLDRSVRLLADELLALGSDAAIVLVPDRNHVNVFDPHPELYPNGLLGRIEDEMWASFLASGTQRSCDGALNRSHSP
jgi:Putative esterase